jgi:hypothetical protein
MKKFTILIYVFVFALASQAQSTALGNISTLAPIGAHIGWDNPIGAPLWINQNNQNRMIFNTQLSWTGINSESATNVNRITLPHTGVALDNQVAWSMLHLWDNDDSASPFTSNMRQAWMDVGLSMTGNQDFLYLGLLERPLGSSSTLNVQTDMVMAWGCQAGTLILSEYAIESSSATAEGLFFTNQHAYI